MLPGQWRKNIARVGGQRLRVEVRPDRSHADKEEQDDEPDHPGGPVQQDIPCHAPECPVAAPDRRRRSEAEIELLRLFGDDSVHEPYLPVRIRGSITVYSNSAMRFDTMTAVVIIRNAACMIG